MQMKPRRTYAYLKYKSLEYMMSLETGWYITIP